MYCPKCRSKFREGISECLDCSIPLVENLPPEEPKPIPEDYYMILALRIIGAIFVILIGGFWNLIITFSDYPSSWPILIWFLYLLVWYAVSAFLVGFLIPAAWYVAILTGVSSLILIEYPNIFIPLLISVLAFGWIGSRLSVWRN